MIGVNIWGGPGEKAIGIIFGIVAVVVIGVAAWFLVFHHASPTVPAMAGTPSSSPTAIHASLAASPSSSPLAGPAPTQVSTPTPTPTQASPRRPSATEHALQNSSRHIDAPNGQTPTHPSGAWLSTFKHNLYKGYYRTPSRYQYIGYGWWEVWVSQLNTGCYPYVTVNQYTGYFHG